jgi:Trypsin
VVSGYGAYDKSNTSILSDDLRKVDVTVWNNNTPTLDYTKIDCKPAQNTFNDACKGDSGGPLVSQGTSSIPNGPLVGIVSSDLIGSVNGVCGLGGRYMKVAKYVKWIFQTILEQTTPNYVCSSTIFTKPNVEVDGITNWEWSSGDTNLMTVQGSTTGNTATFVNVANASGSTDVILKLKKANGAVIETIRRKVWIGRPGPVTVLTDGTFSISGSVPNITICANRSYCMTASCTPVNDAKLRTTVNKFSWGSTSSGLFRNVSSNNPNPVNEPPYPIDNKVCFGANTAGSYLLTAYAEGVGTCGSSNRTFIINVSNCGFRVAPNPAQNTVSVIFDNPEIKESIPFQLDLLDEKFGKVMKSMKKSDKEESILKKEDNKISMDVSDLPRGTYYLHLTFGDKRIEKVKVILN